MAKDTYYFSHDYNARSDERISYYLSKHGMEGYGIYWLLIEQMHQSADGKLTIALMDGIAYSERVDITLLKECYNTAITCGLFVNDGVKFWSERVLRNKVDLEKSREKKSNAGRLGMQSRWGNHNAVITKNNRAITKHNKGKERKVEEKKEKSLSERELLRLEIIRNLSGNGKTQEEIETLATETVEEDWRQFGRLTEWIAEHTPNVADMKEPITLRQFVKIREEIKDKAKITELLKNMQNWQPLLKKNVSAYQTLLNWAKRENK